MAQVVPAQTVPIPATVPGISKETGEEHRPSSELKEKRESKNLEATEPDSRGSKEVDLERQPASSTHSSQEKAQLERTATNASHRGNKWTWALTCAGLFLSAFLYGLDTTIAADVQGSVYIRFGDSKSLSALETTCVQAYRRVQLKNWRGLALAFPWALSPSFYSLACSTACLTPSGCSSSPWLCLKAAAHCAVALPRSTL